MSPNSRTANEAGHARNRSDPEMLPPEVVMRFYRDGDKVREGFRSSPIFLISKTTKRVGRDFVRPVYAEALRRDLRPFVLAASETMEGKLQRFSLA